jgi:hypothetical protein
MADFCTNCSLEMWGNELPPDLDIKEIAESLKSGTYKPVLCEGCGMRAIGKDDNGAITIAMPSTEPESEESNSSGTKVDWIPLEEWEKDYQEKYKKI